MIDELLTVIDKHKYRVESAMCSCGKAVARHKHSKHLAKKISKLLDQPTGWCYCNDSITKG